MTDAAASTPENGKTITEYELEQCQRANQTGRQVQSSDCGRHRRRPLWWGVGCLSRAHQEGLP